MSHNHEKLENPVTYVKRTFSPLPLIASTHSLVNRANICIDGYYCLPVQMLTYKVTERCKIYLNINYLFNSASHKRDKQVVCVKKEGVPLKSCKF